MTPDIQKALNSFEINTCRAISSTGIDAVNEILPMIHGIATMFEAGFRKENDGQSLFDSYNPELIAAVFSGIGYLAATAKFHAEEI